MNISWYKIATQTGVIKEALRTLNGYDKKIEGKELKSLVDHELSQYDEIIYLNPELEEMLNENKGPNKKKNKEKSNEEKSDNPIINLYKKQFGKKPRKDGVFGSCVISLPRVIGRKEDDFPDISLMTVEEARGAISRFYANYNKGKEWLKVAANCFIELLGIRESDILYKVIHVDESTVHIHCGFLPAYKLVDKDNNTRMDDAGNELYGCNRSIISRGFLKKLHKEMAKKMNDKSMPHFDALTTGEGYYFDPQKMTRHEKIAAERALIEDEILQAKIDKGLITEEEAESQFHYNDFKLKNKKRLIKEKEEEKNSLTNDIEDLKQDKKKLETKIKEFISEKEKLKLELESRLNDFYNSISEIITNALEKFRIEALGMDENDAKTTIKVIENEIKERIEGEMIPLVEVIDEEKAIICEEEMDRDDSLL